MRTSTGTLSAKQKLLEGLWPLVALEVSDRPVEVPRWDWTQVSNEAIADCHGAAVVADDGAVVRVRVEPSGGLQVGRIVHPAADDWAVWTQIGAPYSGGAQCGIGAVSSGGTVIIAYVSSNQRELYYRVSTDRGATYGAEQTLATVALGQTIQYLGLVGGAGYVYIAWVRDEGGVEPNDYLDVARYEVGVGWGAVTEWGPFDTITSCGTCLDGNIQRVVMGGASGLIRQDKDWSGGVVAQVALLAAATGAGFNLEWPRLAKSPDGSGRWYYTWLETWTGAVAGSRVWVACTPSVDEIGEGLLFETNRGCG